MKNRVKLILIFIVVILALWMLLRNNISANKASAIGIIGGADGPTAIFLGSKLMPSILVTVGLIFLLVLIFLVLRKFIK